MPNTYVFTKSLGENICDYYKEKVPITIFRPAIVTGIEKEPLPGWVANFNGPSGLMAGAGTGLLRVFYCDKTCPLFCTPVDTCVNAIIVAAWKKAQKMEKELIPIYNCATGKTNVTELTGPLAREAAKLYPLTVTLWVPGGTITGSRILFSILAFFIHFIPAILGDLTLKALGKPPM